MSCSHLSEQGCTCSSSTSTTTPALCELPATIPTADMPGAQVPASAQRKRSRHSDSRSVPTSPRQGPAGLPLSIFEFQPEETEPFPEFNDPLYYLTPYMEEIEDLKDKLAEANEGRRAWKRKCKEARAEAAAAKVREILAGQEMKIESLRARAREQAQPKGKKAARICRIRLVCKVAKAHPVKKTRKLKR